MKRVEAITRLQEHEADLKILGVARLFRFGRPCGAMQTTIPRSTFLRIWKKGKLGLFELMDVKAYTASILGCEADIMTRDSLRKTLRRSIEAAAIRVF
jgi:hypothetical protein